MSRTTFELPGEGVGLLRMDRSDALNAIDRRTLTVDMILMGASIDQARVVLEAKEAAN